MEKVVAVSDMECGMVSLELGTGDGVESFLLIEAGFIVVCVEAISRTT